MCEHELIGRFSQKRAVSTHPFKGLPTYSRSQSGVLEAWDVSVCPAFQHVSHTLETRRAGDQVKDHVGLRPRSSPVTAQPRVSGRQCHFIFRIHVVAFSSKAEAYS